MCQNLMNQTQHLETIFSKESDQARNEYRICLNASIVCIRYLLRQGIALGVYDESEDLSNQGNFLELLKFLTDLNEDFKSVSLKKALETHKLTTPDIQKDIVNAIATETINAIIRDIGNSLFSILIDECCDESMKEQMAIALRYVDKKGHVIERFLGIEYVTDTTPLSLKAAIEELFSKYGLSMSRLRGQGYNGAYNMLEEFNGLKTLIMKENEYAYYVHCFAHQLHRALVDVAKTHYQIGLLFNLVARVVNVVETSCKCCDMFREKQAITVTEALKNGKHPTGQGLDQETSPACSSDTHWGSHYGTLVSLSIMFSSVIDVLEEIEVDGSDREHRGEAYDLLGSIQSFEFIFNLHLMIHVLGITDGLSQALQRKDHDIVNAMNLVKISKQRLQIMRESGWDFLLDQASSFCRKHDIVVPNLDDMVLGLRLPQHQVQKVTNLHHYRFELFYAVIDMQLHELNSLFTDANIELLLCVACLRPNDSFSTFDKQKLIHLAEFYPKEFSALDLIVLDNQLDAYIIDMRSSSAFSGLKGIGDLAQKMVETKKDKVYPLVYLLVTLALILPIATPTIERSFSVMKIVKCPSLLHQMGDQLMNDNLVVYVEQDIFDGIDNEVIIQRFQNMKTHREQL